MEITNNPKRGLEGASEKVEDTVQVALEGPTELVEKTLVNVRIRTQSAFTVANGVNWKTIEGFEVLKKRGQYGVRVRGHMGKSI